ncbi:PREDICTED: DNA-directed RNA polymerase I subunit RPA49-like [Eufriesea mexicana]|uniref:DNA-directed RNA polymerase I subunit RPA49-like n=1 Tax=Eufriesea mexicana TaxID=516756 RepID=UPI00083C62CC|nr:PREDICTED: DNA-directed RNA polymerase I subunit RPA49-like [Eufriesea mexicana]
MKRLLKAIIEDVIIEPSKIQPIIVNFQNGELKDEEAKKMSCGLFYDEKRKKTMLALSNGQIVYRGYKPDTSKDLMRTMLVLHNKKTGKVRLVQVERWQVTPVLEKPIVEDNKGAEDEKIATLNKQFGSKKVKRRTEQYERLKVNVESVKEQLEQTVSSVEIDRMELSTQLSDNEYITNTTLPDCNRGATNVNDVYSIYDIVPESKLETLYNNVTEILNEHPSSSERSSKFFSQMLKYVKSDSNSVKKTALLLYIQAVATWLNMPIRDAKKRGVEVCSVSHDINLHVIDTYSVQSNHGRMRPTSIKDKGVLHCMILALIICNFSLDLELFSTIFSHRIGLKKLTDLARIIGALPNKEDKKIVTLKVPLPAPVSVVKKGKKK